MVLFACALQGRNTTAQPAFDAASVKIDRTRGPVLGSRMKGGPGTGDPGRIVYTKLPLMSLLTKACDVEEFRIAGPAWLAGPERYMIAATMPPQTTRQQFQLMLQNLLIERFQIKLHHETRMFPGYDLVIAPGGPKLKASAPPSDSDADADLALAPTRTKLDADGFLVLPPGHGQGIRVGDGVRAKFQNYTIGEFAGYYLENFILQSTGAGISHVEDKTGLAGEYDFTLKFDARESVVAGSRARADTRTGEASSVGSESGPSGLPNLFKALEKQLGLRLVKVKAFPLDTIVIDHVERVPVE